VSDLPTPALLEAIAAEIVAEGAAAIRKAAGELGAIRTKSGPTDPVTALDVEIERLVRGRLGQRTPGASIIGEERGISSGDGPLGWVLDPIDGTVNLMYDLPFIAVSLAATLDGEVVAGAVVDVWRDEVFSASRGGGAQRNSQPISVAIEGNLAAALVTTGFAYSADGRVTEAEVLTRIVPAARDIRCFGSAALQLCWVACGRVDAFYQRDMQPWDYAAGAIIALESGARVEFPSTANRSLMVAAGPGLFEAIRQVVA